MSMNSKQPHFAMHPSLSEPKYTTLHSSSEAIRRACLQTPQVNYSPAKNFGLFFFPRGWAACSVEGCLCLTRGAPRHIQPRRALNVFFMYSTTRMSFLFESMLIFMTCSFRRNTLAMFFYVAKKKKSRLINLFMSFSLTYFFLRVFYVSTLYGLFFVIFRPAVAE